MHKTLSNNGIKEKIKLKPVGISDFHNIRQAGSKPIKTKCQEYIQVYDNNEFASAVIKRAVLTRKKGQKECGNLFAY